MRLLNSAAHYGLVSKLLHWVIALSMIGLIWLGWYMVDLTYFDKWYNQSLSLHKALGMLVLGLALVLFVWKIVSPAVTSRACEHPVVATLRRPRYALRLDVADGSDPGVGLFDLNRGRKARVYLWLIRPAGAVRKKR